MADRKLLGIDIGTQGVKAALFSENGECLATAFRASSLHQPLPGVVEENPEFQLTSVYETIRECLSSSGTNPEDVAGLAIDGQMAGVIGIGTDGAAVTPYDSWLDNRCSPYIAQMSDGAGDDVLAKTGCSPSVNHGPKILWWMHGRPDVFKRVQAFVQPGGYAAMRLCGLDASAAFIDTTYLHFSGFADNKNSRWDEELCRKFGLDMAKLPRIVDPQEIIGQVSANSAEECGLWAGTPVVAGCGDTAASFLACGATAEGICVDVAGTASVFATTTSEFRPDMEHGVLACGHSAVPGLWHPYAYVSGGGMNLEWFLREIANRGDSDAVGALTFDDLQKLAEAIAVDEEMPLFVPHLAGRACPSRAKLRGAWVGLNWSTTIGHLYRAVLEAVALEYGIYKEILLSLYPGFDLREIRITGGGERSCLWNLIKADVLQTPVVRISRSEGAPLGSALLAGFGVGVFDDLPNAARQWISTGSVVKPDPSMAEYYQRRLKRYKYLLDAFE
ncbi:MAG: xylulokinase [Armatimonadota bacterium]